MTKTDETAELTSGSAANGEPVATPRAAGSRTLLRRDWTPLQLVECIERELGYRRRVYPKMVASGRMSQDKSDREISQMETIKEKLQSEALRGCPTLL